MMLLCTVSRILGRNRQMPPNPLTSWIIVQLQAATRRADELADPALRKQPGGTIADSAFSKLQGAG
jgi:hypothetical protein